MELMGHEDTAPRTTNFQLIPPKEIAIEGKKTHQGIEGSIISTATHPIAK